MIEKWKIKKVYGKRAMAFCPFHESQKGSADLDISIEGKYTGYYRCWSCGKSGQVPMEDVEKLRAMRTKQTQKPTNINWTRLNQEYITQRITGQVSPPLKVSKETLNKLDWGWDHTAHTFPEKNENGEIIGILRRFPDRNKGVVSGSKRGLTIPRINFDPSKKLFITEGLSDLSAILEAGQQGIARPNSNSCNEMCVEFCKDFESIIIIADNDPAGVSGANELLVHGFENDSCVKVIWCEDHNDLYQYFCEEGLERVKSWLVLQKS